MASTASPDLTLHPDLVTEALAILRSVACERFNTDDDCAACEASTWRGEQHKAHCLTGRARTLLAAIAEAQAADTEAPH